MSDWKKKTWQEGKALVQFMSQRNVTAHAASASFFIVLAFFPTLVLLLGLVRYAGYPAETLIELLEGLVPTALMPTAEKLIFSAYRNTTGTILSFSALTALWSAGRGIYGVLGGLNAIYDAHENRGFFYTRAVSMLYIFVFLLVLLLTLVLHVFGKSVIRWLNGLHVPVVSLLTMLVNQRFLVLLVVLTVAFTAMYMFLPNKKNKFRESLPGACMAAVGWQLLSLLFSVYVSNVNGYASVFGSVYAVALSMLWLFLCVCILFYGAALNRWLKEN